MQTGSRLPTVTKQGIQQYAARWKESIPFMQYTVYVMCGGGFLGKFAAEQPADFYIDSRVSLCPYPKKKIERAVQVLVWVAEANGLDPHNMPSLAPSHNMGGIF